MSELALNARVPSRIVADDEPVLRGRQLIPGRAVPLFHEEVWDLSCVPTRVNLARSSLLIDFTVFHDPQWQLTAKEFLHALLNQRIPPAHRRLAVSSAYRQLLLLRGFRDFLAVEGIDRLDAVSLDVLDRYRYWVDGRRARGGAGMPIAEWSKRPWLALPARLAQVGHLLSNDRLLVVPSRAPLPKVPTENATPRIPEPVLAPYLRWAIFYVQVAADDILQADAELALLGRNHHTGNLVLDRFDAWAEARRQAGRGVPGRDERERRATKLLSPESPASRANRALVAAQAGFNPARFFHPPLLRRLEAAVESLGLESGGLDTEISINPATGAPWRGRFSPWSVTHEKRMLVAACYIVCAYLSGMRDSELQAMERGCHIIERSADGVIERHKVHSKVTKGRGEAGDTESWVVIEPVAEAIAALERLTDGSLLFVPPARSVHGGPFGAAMNALLNDFRDYLNATQRQDGALAIPDHDGESWHFSTSQFRRTIAWHIANQPFGVVAGKIQYKHFSVATFEGYAGTSASGFRAEVESERAFAQMSDIVERYEDWRDGVRLTGPGAARVRVTFERVRDELGDFPGRVADRGELAAMLAHVGRTLHVGVLNDCFWDPATARCASHLPASQRSGPRLPLCAPSQCANSCISERHLQPWQEADNDVRVMLRNTRLTTNQRAALGQQHEQFSSVIAGLTS